MIVFYDLNYIRQKNDKMRRFNVCANGLLFLYGLG